MAEAKIAWRSNSNALTQEAVLQSVQTMSTALGFGAKGRGLGHM
jgi:hypothetical protein